MKRKIGIITILFVIVVLVLTIIFVHEDLGTWSETLNIIYTAIFNSKNLVSSDLSIKSQILLFFVTLISSAFQLGIIIFFLNLAIRWFLVRNKITIDSFYQFIEEYQVRKIIGAFMLISTFVSMILIKTIEQLSWLDTFYFTIITMTTVGFGDITSYDISKVFTIILILNGIALIALLSQVLINRIIDLQLSRQYSLPTEPLDLENHIIIAGYGSKGRRLAQLFKERNYRVIIVELDEDRAKLAEFNNYEYVLNGDITKPALLDILSLESASALVLLLSDDNLVIQTGIIARSIAPNLDIYGEFLKQATYKIARYAGINKPISLSVFLTNEIQTNLSRADIQPLRSIRDLRQQETMLGFVQVPMDFEYNDIFEKPVVIGEIATGLNEIYLDRDLSINYEKPPVYTNHLLIGVDKEELSSKEFIRPDREERIIKRIIFAGYSSLVDSLIERLDFPQEDIIVLWHKPKDLEKLQEKQFKYYQWTLESGHEILEQLVKDGDLVICSFDDITSSLIVGVAIGNLNKNTQLIQLVPYEYDIEPLIKIGAEVVYTPQQIISKAILSIFLKDNNIPPSLIFTNGHIYEHLVVPSDYFEGKSIEDLINEEINLLYIMKSGEEQFERPEVGQIIEEGDRLLIFIINIRKERIDTIA